MSWNVDVKIPADEFWGDLEGETLKGVDVVVNRAADAMVTRIREILRSSSKGTGPAVEGAPPRGVDSAFINSVKYTPAERSGNAVFSKVYTDDERAAHNEFGHIEPDKTSGLKSGRGHVGKMARPHPFFRPAFHELGSIIAQRFHEHFG